MSDFIKVSPKARAICEHHFIKHYGTVTIKHCQQCPLIPFCYSKENFRYQPENYWTKSINVAAEKVKQC